MFSFSLSSNIIIYLYIETISFVCDRVKKRNKNIDTFEHVKMNNIICDSF